jgi:hypothetical protein
MAITILSQSLCEGFVKLPHSNQDNSKPWIDQRESVRAISGNHVYSQIWKCPANCGNGKLPSLIVWTAKTCYKYYSSDLSIASQVSTNRRLRDENCSKA